MTPQKFAKNILKKIRDQHISPRPRWEFLLKDYTMWVAFGLCVIIGGIASSVTIFRLINSDWDVYERTGHSFASFAFESMPYFWILLFALFVVIAYLNFTHTKKGYKYGLGLIIFGSVCSSVILGFALFGVGVAKHIEDGTLKAIPLYREINLRPKMQMWTRPEDGLLSGEVLEIFEDKLQIESFLGEPWFIVDMKPPQMIRPGIFIQAIGEVTDDHVFQAEKIRPWRGGMIPDKRILKEFTIQWRSK